MKEQLYAIVIRKVIGKKKGRREFRIPDEVDIKAYEKACEYYRENLSNWIKDGFVPNDEVYHGYNTKQILNFGVDRWYKFFSPRQLLSLKTINEEIIKVKNKLDLSDERNKAIMVYLTFVLDKCTDYNSYCAAWDSTRFKICHVFSTHDYALKSSFGEMNFCPEGIGAIDWSTSQVIDAYKGLCKLLKNVDNDKLLIKKRVDERHFVNVVEKWIKV